MRKTTLEREELDLSDEVACDKCDLMFRFSEEYYTCDTCDDEDCNYELHIDCAA